MKLSNEELETLLTYDYFDKTVSICTTQDSVRRRLEKRIGDVPGVKFGGSQGAWVIEIPMALCRKPDQMLLPHRVPMTEEQRAVVGERLRQYRKSKLQQAA